MPVLQTCWSPCWCHSTVKHGSIYVGAYSIVTCIVGIVYCAWLLGDGPSSEMYSPFFESDAKFTHSITGGLIITCLVLSIIFSILLIIGIRRDNRALLLPFMITLCILILFLISLGIWFIARYYTYSISVLSAILTWLFAGMEIYCFLCVLSQYQILRDYQSNIRILYP